MRRITERWLTLVLAARYLFGVFPRVDRELERWRLVVAGAADRELAAQGQASIAWKRFHCQGGGFYALLPGRARQELLSFIVAFQTISDYLDNLCDRSGCLEAEAFATLHLAYTDALDPEAGTGDYYARYPFRRDGGYLKALVGRCQEILAGLPSYPAVREEAVSLARLYCKLQTYKHTHPLLRESLLKGWFEQQPDGGPELDWWEFAAASGSTLGIFALCSAASRPGLTREEARAIGRGYFPWICGLHILLDYFIDQEEDRAGGDLNFVSYYQNTEKCLERLSLFLRMALEQARGLPDPFYHVTVVRGLPAFYLSDPKVGQQGLEAAAGELLKLAGPESCRMHAICRWLRKRGVI